MVGGRGSKQLMLSVLDSYHVKATQTKPWRVRLERPAAFFKGYGSSRYMLLNNVLRCGD